LRNQHKDKLNANLKTGAKIALKSLLSLKVMSMTGARMTVRSQNRILHRAVHRQRNREKVLDMLRLKFRLHQKLRNKIASELR